MAAGLERSEVRSFLREQPEGKRVTVAFEFAKDRKLAQALLSSPSIRMTGLTPEVFQQVHEAYLEHHHGDEIGEIDAHLADIEALASTVQLVSTKLAGASGMTEDGVQTVLDSTREGCRPMSTSLTQLQAQQAAAVTAYDAALAAFCDGIRLPRLA